MPPKAKFTKEDIIDAGLAILRERDISAVTAREIGNYLGSSARPIFTVFDNMGEVLFPPTPIHLSSFKSFSFLFR